MKSLFKIIFVLLIEWGIIAFKHLSYGLVFGVVLTVLFGAKFSILNGFCISYSIYLVTKLIRSGWKE